MIKDHEVASESLLKRMQSTGNRIIDSEIKETCKKRGVSYNLVMSDIQPYTDHETHGIQGLAVPYWLNEEGSKFLSRGAWTGKDEREKASKELDSINKEYLINKLKVLPDNEKRSKLSLLINILAMIFAGVAAIASIVQILSTK